MFGLFMALFGGTYATGKVLHGELNKIRGNAYVNSLNCNQILQREYQSMAYSTERRPELEKICGYRIDPKSSRDVNEAVRDAVTKAGFRYFDLDELCLDPNFNKANGYRQRSPVEADRFRRNREKIEAKKQWRFEHPHGKELPISPLEYLTKEAYLEAVDKAWFTRTMAWKHEPSLYAFLKRKGYSPEYMYFISPDRFETEDEYIAAIDEYDKEKSAVYTSWIPKNGTYSLNGHIRIFESDWDSLIKKYGSDHIDDVVKIYHDKISSGNLFHELQNWRDYCAYHGYDYEKHLTDEDRKILNGDN